MNREDLIDIALLVASVAAIGLWAWFVIAHMWTGV